MGFRPTEDAPEGGLDVQELAVEGKCLRDLARPEIAGDVGTGPPTPQEKPTLQEVKPVE